MEKELHHVGLSKELCDSRKFVRPDLDPARVDLVFLLGLPELVDPAERITRLEHRRREVRQNELQPALSFGRQVHGENGRVGPKYLRKHPRRVPAC